MSILGVRIGPALQYHECCRRWRPRIMEEIPFSSIPFAHSGNSLSSISVGHAPHTQTPLLSFEAERTKRKRHPRTICSTIPLHEIPPKSESIGKRISRKNELRRMRVVVRFIRSAAPKVTRISCTQTLIAIGASIASCCLYWSGRGLSGPHRWTISSA